MNLEDSDNDNDNDSDNPEGGSLDSKNMGDIIR